MLTFRRYSFIFLLALLLCYIYMVAIINQIDQLELPNYDDRQKDLQNLLAFTAFDNSKQYSGQKFWNSIQPRFQCPQDQLIRVGADKDGGKWTCGLTHLGNVTQNNPNIPCFVYSFGVSLDSSFEAEVLANTLCTVYAYDPTVDKIGQPLNSRNPRVHFFKSGIGGVDRGNLKTLGTLMQENGGHEWIDILKIDVEGVEFSPLVNILQSNFGSSEEESLILPFGQLLIEIHVFDIPWINSLEISEMLVMLFQILEKRGLRMFSKEINFIDPEHCSEFSFINVRALSRFLPDEDIQWIVNDATTG